MFEHIIKMYFGRMDAGNFKGAKRAVDEIYNAAYEIYRKSENYKKKEGMLMVLKKLDELDEKLDDLNYTSEQNRRTN